MFLPGNATAQAPIGAEAKPEATTEKSWDFTVSVLGYLVPDDESFVNPIFTADHRWLHLEARYNDEDIHTGSVWAGYKFEVGQKLQFEAIPMVGAVFGKINGISPGAELALTYKKLELSTQLEYVFDLANSSQSFWYNWTELRYTPIHWFFFGLISEHTKVYQTPLNIDRGFFVGFAYKDVEFATYVYNFGWEQPTVILSLTYKF